MRSPDSQFFLIAKRLDGANFDAYVARLIWDKSSYRFSWKIESRMAKVGDIRRKKFIVTNEGRMVSIALLYEPTLEIGQIEGRSFFDPGAMWTQY